MAGTSFNEIEILKSFEPISLEEMDSVKLMNRTDTKFVFKRQLLNDLLPELAKSYRVLNVNGNLISRYKTLYFDTQSMRFYTDHHNGRIDRYKVRIRKYVESELFFLEIKHKFKGRTDKRRIRISDFETELSPASKAFVNEVLGFEANLDPKLWNSFGRITLVNKTSPERLTIDLNLGFEHEGKELEYERFVIAELKQENQDRESAFYKLMKKNLVRPTGMSKYCLGAISMDQDLKYNRFKEKKLLIQKLSQV